MHAKSTLPRRKFPASFADLEKTYFLNGLIKLEHLAGPNELRLKEIMLQNKLPPFLYAKYFLNDPRIGDVFD